MRTEDAIRKKMKELANKKIFNEPQSDFISGELSALMWVLEAV